MNTSHTKLFCLCLLVLLFALASPALRTMAQENSVTQIQRKSRNPITKVAGADAHKICDPNQITAPFNNGSNGFDPNFDADREAFEEIETICPDPKTGEGGGLGPVYNNTSCVGCHQNPVTGSSSQISEIRAGHFGFHVFPVGGKQLAFFDHPGGSVIHQRATSPRVQEHLLPDDPGHLDPADPKHGDTSRTLRMSTNILGDGFVECIDDNDLILNQLNNQKSAKFGDLSGTIVFAPVALTATTSKEHVGRFGWKSQHASLLNFSADAYLNEMGITSVLQPQENFPNGNPIPPGIDPLTDPEDEAVADHPFGKDVEAFTNFMRSTNPPPPDTGVDVSAGKALFLDNNATGCAICHTPQWKTASKDSTIDGHFPGNIVGDKLGDKVIYPYSDFLLHDIGTGDGIVQTQHAQFPPKSANRVEPFDARPKVESELKKQGKSDLEMQQMQKQLKIVRLLVSQKPQEDQKLALDVQTKTTDPRVVFDETNHRTIFGGDLVDTANKIRTAPLWGLRMRPQLLHDGSALTIDEAIRRHSGQAEKVKLNYVHVLTQAERDALLAFLSSL